MEKRLRRLEKIYNDKADHEEEERSVEPEAQLIDIDIFHREVNFSWQFFKYVPHGGTTTNRRDNLTISSYFAHRHRFNNTIIADFHTSSTSKREQEYITWEASEQYYHICYYSDLEMVKLKMEGDENSFLHVFLSTRKSSLYELMSDLNSPNIFFPAERAKLKNVKITLPVFSIDKKTDMKNVLEKVGIKEQSLLHEAHFQLNQSGVNVPHVPLEETSFERINPSETKETIEFLANRPFLFMLTKSDHVMYIGWYQ
ncbi:hypothetical protein CAEBREN_06974 [Caenorhabditis brenneri]|uniref:Serpin domain-containing protein n=1 Tax=Caenorhabditis brenneri TaxID=135651 RepID=G0NJ10_CAEBE|nr:hypothetical protein CAEBREN_06974 [Caenorhabditis brenneri]